MGIDKCELFLDREERALERASSLSFEASMYIRGLVMVTGTFFSGSLHLRNKSFLGCCLMFRVELVM